MKEIYVDGYDTIVEFPDSVGDAEIQRVLKERFPETGEQLVARVSDPNTDPESITLEDFKRFKEEKPEATWGELGSAVVTGASTVATEIASGVVAGMKQTAKGNLSTVGKSAVEGAGRGTVDVGTLAARIGDHITTKLEDLIGGTSGDDLEDQFKRFKAIKRLDHWREKARQGETTITEIFGIKKEDVDPELAEAFSYVLDPTALTGAGLGGKVGAKAARLASKPVAAAGRAMEAGAGVLRRVGEKIEGGLEAATKAADDIVPGGGRYLPGAIGAGAVVSGTAGYGAAALGAVPTLELGGAIARGLSESMAQAPTRTGTLARLARNAPDTWAGRAAGRLEVFDRAIEYTGRAMAGGAAGATVGAGLGLAAGGLEGAAQGLGTGLAAGAGGGVAGRFHEGLTGNALRTAERADYDRFRSTVDQDTGAFLDKLGGRDQIQAMDLIEVANGMAGGDTVRVVSSRKFREQFGEQVGAQVVEGERPVIYIDGGRGDMRTLAHETFHALARLDGFDAMALKISDRLKTLHGEDAIGKFTDEYMMRLDSDARSKFAQRETKQADILEEMGAEYFAHFLSGKRSSFLIRGDSPIQAAVDAVAKRFAAGKLDRMADAFESPIFDSRIKKSAALDMAMSELTAARRRAHRAVELSTDAPVQIIGVDDLGDEVKFNQLVKMGLARTDAKGKHVLTKRGEEKKIAATTTAAVARAVEGALDTGGVVRQADGSYAGNLSPEQFDAILGAADVPDKVKEVLKFMRANAREGRPANVTYGAATFRTKTGKVRYRNLPVSNRDVLIYETIISPKTGTMRAKVLDLSYMAAKARREFLGSERIQREFVSVDRLIRTLHDYIRGLQSGSQPTADIVGGEAKRDILNKMLGIRNVGGNPLIPEGTGPKGSDHPWRDFRLDRVIAMRQLDGDPLSFSDAAYRRGQTNFRPGATQKIYEDDIARFTPAPDNPNADIRDFIGKRVQMLTTDQSTSVDKEAGGMVVNFRGGPGYLKLFDGWAFTDKKAASGFRSRWLKDGQPLIGLTSLSPRNHLNLKLTRRYVGAKWKGAVESGQIGKTVANRHIREVMRRFLAGKNKLNPEGRKLVAGVKNYLDLGPAIEAMPWAAAGDMWVKFDAKTLPIPQEKLRELGLDTDSIATETREPAYHGVETGSLLAIAEYDGTAPVYRPEINESYPWFVPLKDKAFLKEFANALELTSYEQVRNKTGGPNAQVMMVKGPILDKLESGDVRFSPSHPMSKMTAKEIADWAAAIPAKEVREMLSKVRLTPTKQVLEMLGAFPEYLEPVLEYIVEKSAQLKQGRITPRDVAKAYFITLSSIGADQITVTKLAEQARAIGIPFEPDPMYVSYNKEGTAMMRPEELAAWWLGTESGQRALDAIEQGRVDMDAWEVGMAMRDAYGRQDFRPNDKGRVGGVGRLKKRGEFNLTNIMDLTAAINETRGDPAKLKKTLMKMKGISTAKWGFIGHLLGFGKSPTVDAVELNVWMTGKGSTKKAPLKDKKRRALANQAERAESDLADRIARTIAGLRNKVPGGEKIPKDVAPHIIHHWIWDAAKGIQTTHAGLYNAMVNFTPSKQLKAPGGAVYESPTGHRAVQTSGRAKVRVYDPAGRRIGPLFSSVEKAQDWVRNQR